MNFLMLAQAAAKSASPSARSLSTISAFLRKASRIVGRPLLDDDARRAQLLQRQRLGVRRAAQHPGDVGAAGGLDLGALAAGSASHLSLRIRKSITAEGCCQPGR